VVDDVTEALEVWRSGERHWSAWWEETRQECRSLIAAHLQESRSSPLAQQGCDHPSVTPEGCQVSSQWHRPRRE
jgi:hypothetical protein